MYFEWTRHLQTEEEKKRFRDSIYGSRHVMSRLKAILEEKEKTLDREEMLIETMNNPNWSHKQAFKNGQRNSLDFLKKLVDLDIQQVVPQGDNT